MGQRIPQANFVFSFSFLIFLLILFLFLAAYLQVIQGLLVQSCYPKVDLSDILLIGDGLENN